MERAEYEVASAALSNAASGWLFAINGRHCASACRIRQARPPVFVQTVCAVDSERFNGRKHALSFFLTGRTPPRTKGFIVATIRDFAKEY